RVTRKSKGRSWIFRPDLRKMQRGKGCRRRVRMYDEELGRWVRRCPEENGGADASLTNQERSLILEAQATMRSGGGDPGLDRDSGFGWATFKAANDLKTYLTQPPSPTICTGAIRFAEHYLT